MPIRGTVEIRPALTPVDFAAFGALCAEYGESLEYTAECASLEHQGFDYELRTLPGRYARPGGEILLACEGETAVGCVALRPLDGTFCEMKRLYVRPSHRGNGVGRRLADAIVQAGRDRAYTAMRLDTGQTMAVAAAMYRGMGFREIPAYNRDPVPGTVWMELVL